MMADSTMLPTQTQQGSRPEEGRQKMIEANGFKGAEDQSDDSGLEDQDDAHAFLQPAISAAASHLTSFQTPAVDKAAAFEKKHVAGYFDNIVVESDEDNSPPSVSPKQRATREQASSDGNLHLGELPPRSVPRPTGPRLVAPESLPSPWTAGPRELVIASPVSGSARPSAGIMGSALGTEQQGRPRRSGSAGQEALKRLQKALPSFNTPHFPSLASLSSFADRHMPGSAAGRQSPNRPVAGREAPPMPSPRQVPQTITNSQNRVPARPRIIRRTTSDESILYHSLSRASSLGDDSQFSDVREMVNMRLMAMKDSLPDVPRFKMPSMPSLPKVNTSSWRNSFNSGLGGSSNPSEINLAQEPSSGLPRKSGLSQGASTVSLEGEAILDKVLEDLTGDIVVMGGYRGSILRSAEAPHQQLWAPVKVGLNIRKANLEVGLDDEDEEAAEKTIIPSGMLKHIGPIDIARKFIRKLENCENAKSGKLRVWDFGYDWRLSPRISSRKLVEYLERMPSNQPGVKKADRGALVIAHSLGGLITRHAVNQRPELFSGVLYAGVPQRCINVLGPLRNGDAVLLNEKLLTAAVNFSIRTSFVFLPEDGFCFIDKQTGEEYPVDFYDAEAWVKTALSPCVGTVKPPFNRPHSSSLSSFLPNPLRARAGSRSEKKNAATSGAEAPTTDGDIAPQMADAQQQTAPPSTPSNPASHARYVEYLTRTLAATKKFRSELAHIPAHQDANLYPPLAVLYGKTVPTVYAVQVNGRESIAHTDCYDDLLFRAGDGVTLAREAMLPEGYSMVKGGRVSTERGHITMLGDMPAMGRAMEALVRGRRKGIGLGETKA